MAAFASILVPLMGSSPAWAAPVCNTAPINFTPPLAPLADVQRLLPYPSPITVSGLSGTVTDVNVSLKGLSYPWTADLDVILVAPDGRNLIVMSDIGGTPDIANPVSNIDLTFDDQAATAATFNGQLAAGTYKPTNDNTDFNEFVLNNIDTFSNITGPPNPQFTGPTASTATAFSTFSGSVPNGQWQLWVIDDDPGPAIPGGFAGGWCIDITTAGGPSTPPVADFDGDGKTDASVFRPTNNTWYVKGSAGSNTATNFGTTGDIPVAADYTGDGITEVAVFRPSTGIWIIQGSPAVNWGTSGDIPVPGDYNGNGAAEAAVFRPSTGVWYLQGGNTVWGASGDIPVPGDYDGNGTTDVAVFRPSTGVWYIQGGATVNFGTTGDIPVPGDYNGNGTTDVAVFRPSTGIWYVQGNPAFTWGASGDKPVPLPSAIRQPFFP